MLSIQPVSVSLPYCMNENIGELLIYGVLIVLLWACFYVALLIARFLLRIPVFLKNQMTGYQAEIVTLNALRASLFERQPAWIFHCCSYYLNQWFGLDLPTGDPMDIWHPANRAVLLPIYATSVVNVRYGLNLTWKETVFINDDVLAIYAHKRNLSKREVKLIESEIPKIKTSYTSVESISKGNNITILFKR